MATAARQAFPDPTVIYEEVGGEIFDKIDWSAAPGIS